MSPSETVIVNAFRAAYRAKQRRRLHQALLAVVGIGLPLAAILLLARADHLHISGIFAIWSIYG